MVTDDGKRSEIKKPAETFACFHHPAFRIILLMGLVIMYAHPSFIENGVNHLGLENYLVNL